MPTPSNIDPTRLADLARRMLALDRRIRGEDAWLSYQHTEVSGGEAFIADNGAGDYCVLYVLDELFLLKCFDHESDLSPYADGGGNPDTGLTEGMPPRLKALLAGKTLGLDGDERTFCAWWALSQGEWIVETRGACSDPLADVLELDVEGVLAWLGDAAGLTASAADVRGFLAGDLAANDLLLAPIPESVVGFPLGWRPGDAFGLAVAGARPIKSMAVLKGIRAITGGALGEILKALAVAGPVITATLQLHGPGLVPVLHDIQAVIDILEPEAGVVLRIEVGDHHAQIDRQMLVQMLGEDAMFLS